MQTLHPLVRRPILLAHDRIAAWPKWTGIAAVAGLLASATIYGVVLGGHLPTIANTVTSELGLGIRNVRITGQQEIKSTDLFAALEVRTGSSLLMLDAEQARKRLTRINWVDQVSVLKLYPNTLQITLEERHPFALWQRGKLVSLIDRKGDVITDEVPPKYALLPLLVGHGAQHRAAAMVDMLARYPVVGARVRAAVLISRRRWNLVLENGIRIRLPEVDKEAAVAELARLDKEKSLLSRDIAAVDMRLEDRLVLRLTEAARIRRKAKLEKRRSAPKKGAKI